MFSHWVMDTGGIRCEYIFQERDKRISSLQPTAKKVVKVHKKSPKTGDTENIPFYAGILYGTIIALGATLKLSAAYRS